MLLKAELGSSPRLPGVMAAVLIAIATASTACTGNAVRSSQQGSAPQAALVGQLDARIPRLLSEYEIASVGIAVIADGRVAVTKVYGEQAPGVPASNATLFNLASLTKPVTAEVIMRLASSGALSTRP